MTGLVSTHITACYSVLTNVFTAISVGISVSVKCYNVFMPYDIVSYTLVTAIMVYASACWTVYERK